MSDPGKCVFDAKNTKDFPFQFKAENNTVMPYGQAHDVKGFGEVCMFLTDTCDIEKFASYEGKSFSCCGTTDAIDSGSQLWLAPMIAFFVPFVLFRIVGKMRARAGEAPVERPTIMDFSGMSTMKQYIIMGLFYLCIAATVAEMVIMPKSIQQNLHPADRSAQLAMSAFLVPVAEIFKFLEDAMVVKVGYALASNRNKELNMLLHVGVLGGLISGIFAFLLMVGIAFEGTAAAALLNPSAASNHEHYSDCKLIPTTDELLSNARVYWLLSAGQWIPSFAMKSISGFLISTGQLTFFFVPLVVGGVVPISLWFGLLPLAYQGSNGLTPLTVLAIAYGVTPWINAIVTSIYFASAKDLRDKFGLKMGLFQSGFWSEMSSSIGSIAREGALLMVVDLGVQISLTVTIYIAASVDFTAAYKLAAAQSAYWSFGPSWVVGMMFFIKILGSRLVASGKYVAFAKLFMFVTVTTLSISIAAIISADTKRIPVAYDFGESACIFGSRKDCADVYAKIFTGHDSMSELFKIVGVTTALNMFFVLFRAGLSICHDFKFMAISSVITVVVVYIPAILVARLKYNTAFAYYLVMYLPHFAMIAVFGIRLAMHFRAMFSNAKGPWTKHARRMSIVDGEATGLRSPGQLEVGAEGGGGGGGYGSIEIPDTPITYNADKA